MGERLAERGPPPAAAGQPTDVCQVKGKALEKFVVRTLYYIEAKTPKQAEDLCRSG
jgi:hypothetical protein